MRKNLWSLGLVLLSGMVQKFVLSQKEGYKSVGQLKLKLFYLKTIKTSRLLFLSFLGVGTCLVFLMSSLNMFNAAIFTYSSYSPDTKMWLGFLLAALYLLVAGVIFTVVFSERKWLEIFHLHKILEEMDDTASSEKINAHAGV